MTAAQKTASVGRPRIHANKAAKQKAYRENRAKDAERLAALAQIAVDIAHQIGRAATRGDADAQALAGWNADETLEHLLTAWRHRADSAGYPTAPAPKPRKAQRR